MRQGIPPKKVIKSSQTEFMRLLFLGCSWTYGCELAEGQDMKRKIEERRYSTIIGKKLNAEVVNIAENGMSNHAIARIFLEQDLESFDKIFVQLTYPVRTEWYDSTGMSHKAKSLAKIKEYPNRNGKWIEKMKAELKKERSGIWDSILPNKTRFMITGNLLEEKEWWLHYYSDIYTDQYGITEEMLIFNLIRNKMKRMGKSHLILSINPKCKLPIDLQLNNINYPRAKGSHPNSLGHIMIASDIMRLL